MWWKILLKAIFLQLHTFVSSSAYPFGVMQQPPRGSPNANHGNQISEQIFKTNER